MSPFDIPFELVDLRSFASTGPVFLAPGRDLRWSPDEADASQVEGDLDQSGVPHRWCLTAADCRLGPRTVSVDIFAVEPVLSAEHVGRLSQFLDSLDGTDGAIQDVVRAEFDRVPMLADYLVPELLTHLDAAYLDALFAPRTGPDALAPDEFLRGLALCRVGYDVGDGGGRETAEGFTVDYRLLVSALTEEDTGRIDDLLTFGGRYAVTNQVLSAKVSPDGRVLNLAIES